MNPQSMKYSAFERLIIEVTSGASSDSFLLFFYGETSGEFRGCYAGDGEIRITKDLTSFPLKLLDREQPEPTFLSKTGRFESAGCSIEKVIAAQVQMKVKIHEDSVFVYITKSGLVYRTRNGMSDLADQVTNLEFVRRIKWIWEATESK